MAQMTDASGT